MYVCMHVSMYVCMHTFNDVCMYVVGGRSACIIMCVYVFVNGIRSNRCDFQYCIH